MLDCEYAFDPGTEVDGVTVTIPAEAAGEVPREQLDWLVPGLLADKITALIRGLPKTYRVQLVPGGRHGADHPCARCRAAGKACPPP